MFTFLKDIVSDSLGFYVGPGKILTVGLVLTGAYCYYPASLANSFTSLMNHLELTRCVNQLEGFRELFAMLDAYANSNIQIWPQIVSLPGNLTHLSWVFSDEPGVAARNLSIISLEDLEFKKSLIQAQIDSLEKKLTALDLKRLDLAEKIASEQKSYTSKKSLFWYVCGGVACAVLAYFTGVELSFRKKEGN